MSCRCWWWRWCCELSRGQLLHLTALWEWWDGVTTRWSILTRSDTTVLTLGSWSQKEMSCYYNYRDQLLPSLHYTALPAARTPCGSVCLCWLNDQISVLTLIITGGRTHCGRQGWWDMAVVTPELGLWIMTTILWLGLDWHYTGSSAPPPPPPLHSTVRQMRNSAAPHTGWSSYYSVGILLLLLLLLTSHSHSPPDCWEL